MRDYAVRPESEFCVCLKNSQCSEGDTESLRECLFKTELRLIRSLDENSTADKLIPALRQQGHKDLVKRGVEHWVRHAKIRVKSTALAQCTDPPLMRAP